MQLRAAFDENADPGSLKNFTEYFDMNLNLQKGKSLKLHGFKFSTPDLVMFHADEAEAQENTNYSDSESCCNWENADKVQKTKPKKSKKAKYLNPAKNQGKTYKNLSYKKNSFKINNSNVNVTDNDCQKIENKSIHNNGSKNSLNEDNLKSAKTPLIPAITSNCSSPGNLLDSPTEQQINNYYYNDNKNLNSNNKSQKNNLNFKNELEASCQAKINNSETAYNDQDLYNIPFFDSVESSYNYQGNYQNYISRVLNSLEPLFSIDFKRHVQERYVLLPEYNKKKTLILDLDETLVHADFDRRFLNHDKVLYFSYENELVEVPLFIRPGLIEFLTKVSELFEIFIFTASRKEYADIVLNFLDPENKIFKHRFYRNSCIPINNKVYIKDLGIFVNRKPENMILVDNSFYSFINQPCNGVLINSFYNDKQDRELGNLLNYLQNYIMSISDIRKINEQIFNFENLINSLRQENIKINSSSGQEDYQCSYDD